MKKIDEMKSRFETLKAEAQGFLDTQEIDKAKAKMDEVRSMKEAIQIQEILDKEEMDALKSKSSMSSIGNKTKENANIIRAMLKKVSGAALTEAENALLLPTTSTPAGSNGESYILPQDIRTLIVKKMRDYRSMRDVIGYIPAAALTGSFPVENFETVSALVDFADGTDGTDTNDISFKNVKFSLKEKAAFIKLSNTLLALSDTSLIEYVADIFAKKAVITENAMAVTALKTGKTVKTLADWKALKSSLNVDLDPAVLSGCAIVTNQDGFDFMDKALDETGRPILQRDPKEPTRKMFAGYPVHVFSNTLLPTTAATSSTAAKSPIFYGNLKEAVKLVDLDGAVAFATSKEAGFMSNTTIARLIEFVDVIQVDDSDKCYIYGEFETAPKTGSAG